MLLKSSRDFCCASKDENSGRSTKTKGSNNWYTQELELQIKNRDAIRLRILKRWLALVALTFSTDGDLRVLKAVDGNDMQGRYSGLPEIYHERATKPGRIPRVNKALSKRQALCDQRLDLSGKISSNGAGNKKDSP